MATESPAVFSELIYFAGGAKEGLIKIGIAQNPLQRLRDMQTGSPIPLRLLATIPGDRTIESELHALFAEERRSGEWFHPSAELLDFIREVAGLTETPVSTMDRLRRSKESRKSASPATRRRVAELESENEVLRNQVARLRQRVRVLLLSSCRCAHCSARVRKDEACLEEGLCISCGGPSRVEQSASCEFCRPSMEA